MISNPGTLLSRVLEAVTKLGPRMEKLQKIAAVLRETAGFRWVGLYDIDHAKGEVVNLVWDGPAPPEYPVFPIGKGLTGRAIVEKRIVSVGNVSVDPRYLTALGSTRSEIIVPILNDQEQVVGTIDVESAQLNAFDQKMEKLLEDCAVLLRPLFASRAG
jgi:L-methionine (R)-S-oxide reductase